MRFNLLMPHLKKYHHAGWGFLAVNATYLLLAYIFLPPFSLGATIYLYGGAFLLLVGICSWFVFRGARKLTLILTIIYAARSLISIYTLVRGDSFAAVPYVLPCLLLTVYILGRAVWDWP